MGYKTAPSGTGRTIALFVSPHGLGHATRAAAVGAALEADCSLEIFTRIPRELFAQTLRRPFGHYPEQTDVGLIQASPLEVDLPRSRETLARFLPFDSSMVARLAARVRARECRLILCDIAPLGIAVAQAAGIPSVLIENFTWDWIYRGYTDQAPDLEDAAAYLEEIFAAADYHIQAEPVCRPVAADLTCAPVARRARRARAVVRAELEIPLQARGVVISLGGLDPAEPMWRRLRAVPETWFLVPIAGNEAQRLDRVIFLPESYHPDLIAASDAVISKVGYSTLAEVYHAGLPFGYIERPGFRESAPLTEFITREMSGLSISTAAFKNGDWVTDLPALCALSHRARTGPNGADQIAAFIRNLLARGPTAPPSCGRS